jgi:phytoene synthase
VSRALAPFTARFGIDAARLNEIIDGMEMDLTHHRYPDFESLRRYAHRGAGVVGQRSASIFGYANPSTLQYAESLGMAFQLTNIIRDVGEDARRDRIYLPADEMARFGVSAEDILARRATAGFRDLMAFQADRAEGFYNDAFAKLAEEDRRNQRAGLIMSGIYRTLLAEIRADRFEVLDRRIALTPLRKLWIAWKTWVRG